MRLARFAHANRASFVSAERSGRASDRSRWAGQVAAGLRAAVSGGEAVVAEELRAAARLWVVSGLRVADIPA
ncbi:hypothetical protein Lfu02_27390 [Longispora fulva]|uniref:Uncharacterized protein n=1 Tax=Longispora fulva TaxID=619741 RepID=A0A8J7KL41_9ACTN|nr:hypothetical protein [Longispora fulva]GIG58367.1 hypothetical protein Lfu02_27390 [Longispora fulva]